MTRPSTTRWCDYVRQHPWVDWTGQIIVITIALLLGTVVVGLFLPILPGLAGIALALSLRGFSRQREQARRERQELRAAIARLEARQH